jgi:probable F420-dependent oxidoreductase
VRIGVIVPLAARRDTGEVPTWPEIRRFAEHAESIGVSSLWVFDHLYSGAGDAPPADIHEAWSILTALAAVTSRAELGQLVTCVSFRDPGVLAKAAVTVDAISGGRLTLGLGAGWYDREYHDFGLPTDHRATRFAEALDVILPLLRGETVTTQGTYHRVDGAVLKPAPQRRIPILIAGTGPRMRGLVAAHADAWNTAWYTEPDERMATLTGQMRASLDEAGRDQASLRWTVGMSWTKDRIDTNRKALENFAGQGVDDVIVALGTPSTKRLDQLAEAASAFL